MGGSYSVALREHSIKFVETENGSPKEACAVLCINSSTLTKWPKKYRETGAFQSQTELPRASIEK